MKKYVVFRNGEIETKNYRIWFNYPFIAQDAETGIWRIWNLRPKFLFCDERKKEDYFRRYYKWMLDLGWISIWKKHHRVYDKAAKEYKWNAVL